MTNKHIEIGLQTFEKLTQLVEYTSTSQVSEHLNDMFLALCESDVFAEFTSETRGQLFCTYKYLQEFATEIDAIRGAFNYE